MTLSEPALSLSFRGCFFPAPSSPQSRWRRGGRANGPCLLFRARAKKRRGGGALCISCVIFFPSWPSFPLESLFSYPTGDVLPRWLPRDIKAGSGWWGWGWGEGAAGKGNTRREGGGGKPPKREEKNLKEPINHGCAWLARANKRKRGMGREAEGKVARGGGGGERTGEDEREGRTRRRGRMGWGRARKEKLGEEERDLARLRLCQPLLVEKRGKTFPGGPRPTFPLFLLPTAGPRQKLLLPRRHKVTLSFIFCFLPSTGKVYGGIL